MKMWMGRYENSLSEDLESFKFGFGYLLDIGLISF